MHATYLPAKVVVASGVDMQVFTKCVCVSVALQANEYATTLLLA